MRPWLVCAVLSGVMIFGTSNTVSAQEAGTSSSIRPDFQVTFARVEPSTIGNVERDTFWNVKPSTSVTRTSGSRERAQPSPSLRRGQINRAIEINAFGGYTRFSSPGFVDDACWTFAVLAYDAEDADCWGDGKGNGLSYGGEFGYRYPLRNGMYLVFQGGAEFGSQHLVEVELEGTEPTIGAQYYAVEGYHFRTTHIYGGVGVRMNQMMIGGTFGRTLHSGHDYFQAELSLAGIPLDSTYEEGDESGSGGLFGLRFQYDLRPGLGMRVDYRFFGFDTGTPELPTINHRTATFAVVVDLPRFFSR